MCTDVNVEARKAKTISSQFPNFPHHHDNDYDGDDLCIIIRDVLNGDNADVAWNKKAENNQLANFPDLAQFPPGIIAKSHISEFFKTC